MMEAARTSEMLVNCYQTTRRYNPEDSHLHTRHCENLKSYYFKASQHLLGRTDDRIYSFWDKSENHLTTRFSLLEYKRLMFYSSLDSNTDINITH
jgi:hypothetical protein